jgi:hypothetical protein
MWRKAKRSGWRGVDKGVGVDFIRSVPVNLRGVPPWGECFCKSLFMCYLAFLLLQNIVPKGVMDKI